MEDGFRGRCMLIYLLSPLLCFQGLALEYMPTLREAYASSTDPETKILLLRTMFDLVALYGATNMGRGVASDALQPLIEAMQDPNETIHSTAVHGIAKLVLMGQIEDEKTLRMLATFFFHPATADNPKLRQALSVFFQIYPHSSKSAKLALAKVVPPLWFDLVGHYKRLDKESQSSMTAPLLLGQQLLDWIDMRKLEPRNHDADAEPINLHLQAAFDIVMTLLTTKSASVRKLTCQMFGKLDLETPGSIKTIKKLLYAVERLKQFINDTTALNALKK